MARLSRDKYLPNEGQDFVEEVMRKNETLERRISDLERALMNQDTPPAIPRIDPVTYPDPYEGQRAIDITDEQHTWYSDGEWRKAGGMAIYEIKVFEDISTVVVGDKAFQWEIPEDLDNAEIIKVEAFVTTVGSGNTEIQLHKLSNTGASLGDILSTKIVIESGEYNSADAATQPVISGGTHLVQWGEHLRIDIDAVGSGSMGLGLMVTLIPSPLGSVAIEGSQGPPGGEIDWSGSWTTSTTYVIGDAVTNNGSTYVAIADHTSGSLTEPGVGANWETAWMLLAAGQQISGLTVALNGNGYPLDVGQKVRVHVPFACTITEASLLADIAGNVVIDIWNDDYGVYPPTDADSITASAPLTLSGANKTKDTTLTGWATSLAADDTLIFNVDSCSVITALTVALKVERIQ